MPTAPSLSPPHAAPRRWWRPSWAITAPSLDLRPLWRPDGLGPAGAPGLPRASDPRRPVRDRCRRYRSRAGTEGPAETRLRHRATPRGARGQHAEDLPGRPQSRLDRLMSLVPTTRAGAKLHTIIRKCRRHLFVFMTNRDVTATNNRSERALRPVPSIARSPTAFVATGAPSST